MDDLMRQVELAEAKRTVQQMKTYLAYLKEREDVESRGSWAFLFHILGSSGFPPSQPCKPYPGEYEKAVALLNDEALSPR